jgi:tetraacyldisaccharide 4'-kinase
MGGRGKSPLAGLVAQILLDAGERPSILSRGYGREIADDGVTIVADGDRILSDLAHSGDEPLMLARAVPGAAVLVCEQRALAGTLAERALGCTVHVLDDGFQHHQLHRDVDIVLVDAEDFSGRPLPFGRLREPVAALRRADALIAADGSSVQHVQEFKSAKPDVFRGSLVRELGTLEPKNSGTLEPLNPGTAVFAFAGIARPERFFDSLKSAGYNVVGTLGFGDHHRYTDADLQTIRNSATSARATAVVTTSKDMVRLGKFNDSPLPLVEIPLSVSVQPAAEFRAWLLRRLAEARGAEASADAKAARA